MQKSRYNVTIHKTGVHNGNILTAVSNHNEGIVPVDIKDFQSWLQVWRAIFPTVYWGLVAITEDDAPHILYISEDGGATYTLTLEYCEIFQLEDYNEGEEIAGEELAEAHVLHNPSNQHP